MKHLDLGNFLAVCINDACIITCIDIVVCIITSVSSFVCINALSSHDNVRDMAFPSSTWGYYKGILEY